MKKSKVCIIALSSDILYTDASSEDSYPTIKFSFLFFDKSFNKSERAPGPIFEFQPPQTFILNFLLDILPSFIFISLFEIYKKIT